MKLRYLITLVILFFGYTLLHSQVHRVITLDTVLILENKNNDTSFGIDISRHQGNIKWYKLDTSIDFVFIKVSEGISRTDIKFKQNWDSCNILKGGYHFFRPQVSGRNQAQLFLNILPLDIGTIIPCIDVEYTTYWLSKRNRKHACNNLKSMIEYVTKMIGTEPIIYTGKHFWEKYIQPNYKYSISKLWVADYKHTKPYTPNNMTWNIWQYSNKGKVMGIFGNVDMNVCPNINILILKNNK